MGGGAGGGGGGGDGGDGGQPRRLVGSARPPTPAGLVEPKFPARRRTLGQIFMARQRPPRAGRERSAAALPGPADGTRDHPPVRRPRFGGDLVVGEGARMGPPAPHVRLLRSAAPPERSGPPPRLPGPHGRRPHGRTSLPPRSRRPPERRV